MSDEGYTPHVERAEARLVEFVEALREDRHVVEFLEDTFALQHPVLCRPDLIGCPINRAIQALDGPPALGRYRVTLEDGQLRYEPDDGEDPVLAALSRVSETSPAGEPRRPSHSAMDDEGGQVPGRAPAGEENAANLDRPTGEDE